MIAQEEHLQLVWNWQNTKLLSILIHIFGTHTYFFKEFVSLLVFLLETQCTNFCTGGIWLVHPLGARLAVGRDKGRLARGPSSQSECGKPIRGGVGEEEKPLEVVGEAIGTLFGLQGGVAGGWEGPIRVSIRPVGPRRAHHSCRSFRLFWSFRSLGFYIYKYGSYVK